MKVTCHFCDKEENQDQEQLIAEGWSGAEINGVTYCACPDHATPENFNSLFMKNFIKIEKVEEIKEFKATKL